MDHYGFAEDLKKIILPVLEEENVELVELRFIRAPRGSILRLLVDKQEGGINIDECSRLNQRISDLLDAEDIIKNRYILEVSSPGLDRLLKTKSDFLRCINRRLRFFLKGPINGKVELEGIIKEVKDDGVAVDTGELVVEIPLAQINMAKQIIKEI
jgi:ribosome maturation factor RimP